MPVLCGALVIIVWALIFFSIYSVPWDAVDAWLDADMIVSRGTVCFTALGFAALALLIHRR